MTIDNLELALQLNNEHLIDEINIIISYLNQFYNKYDTDLRELYNRHNTDISNLTTSIQTVSNRTEQINSTLTYNLSLVNTRLTTAVNDLADDYGAHKYNDAIHVTQADKDKWNNIATYTDGTVKSHAENLTIHVTQADKDLWNATLQNAKDYAKDLFDSINSFEIVICEELPTEDIDPHTIYFLQVDPEQDDLYEEYMYIDDAWEKIGNTRIDLSDYVTTSQLQSAVDTLNQTITNKETAINNTITEKENTINSIITTKESALNTKITTLETKHDNDISSLNTSISNINTDFAGINSSVSDIQSDISGINTDIANIQNDLSNISNSTEVQQAINQAVSTLETKHDNDVSTINQSITSLTNKHNQDVQSIQNSISNIHTHANKEILDKFSTNQDNELLFDGNQIKGSGGEEELTEEEIQALILAILQELGTPNGHGSSESGTSTHKHLNKQILDRLSENSYGQLTYKGKLVDYGSSSGSSSGEEQPPISAGIYFSEFEQPIGETEEGNTIYQITKHFATNGINGQEISHEISNIGTVVNIQGIMFDNKNKIPLGFNDNNNNYFSCIINLEKIKLFHTFGENKDVYITIQYTRTGNRFISSDDYYVVSSDDYILAGNAE